MSKTKIEWAEHSWSPVTGCTPVSEGCRNCYACRMARRLAGRYSYPEAPRHFDVTLHPDRLDVPLRRKKPTTYFVCSMGDLFHVDVRHEFVHQIFETMEEAAQHTFLILTKRPERMAWFVDVYRSWRDWPLPNVYPGTSIENQETADERIPWLLQIPAAVRFVSYEPALGPVDFHLEQTPPCSHPGCYSHVSHPCEGCGRIGGRLPLSWVIAGGESGPGARPMHPDWARSLRDQCQAAGVPYFFKSWGAWAQYDAEEHEGMLAHWQNRKNWKERIQFLHVSGSNDPTYKETTTMLRVGKKAAGRLLDGRTWSETPEGKGWQ